MNSILPQTSLINLYAKHIEGSFRDLSAEVSPSEVEEMAIFLVRTMGADLRDYHRPEHSLDVAQVESPIARLAAFYHDLVYVQVDPSWRTLAQYLYPFIPDDLLTLNVMASMRRNNEPWMRGICIIFGIDKETNLSPAKGMNEFLSAIVMFRKLSFYLEPLHLFRAIACVAATVPFLGVDSEGKNPAQRLVLRMKEAAQVLEFYELEDQFYEDTIAECCQIVSTDLASFGSNDFSNYISNTWNVMYESYPPLRNTYYLISDYRKAVFGNVTFLATLDSSRLFWNAYSKSVKIDSMLNERSNYNLQIGQVYLKSVAVGVSIMEAIALATGGDAPYETFLGTMKREREGQPVSISQFIPLPNSIDGDSDDQMIYTVLKEGRLHRARFDRRDNVLGAAVFGAMGRNKVFEAYQMACRLHSGEIGPRAFLEVIPKSMLNNVINAFMKTVLTRTQALQELL